MRGSIATLRATGAGIHGLAADEIDALLLWAGIALAGRWTRHLT